MFVVFSSDLDKTNKFAVTSRNESSPVRQKRRSGKEKKNISYGVYNIMRVNDL